MTYSITYTTNGDTYNLDGYNPAIGITIKYLGDQGFGMAPMHRITQRGPLQQGDSDLGFRLDPRILQLPLVIESQTMSEGYTVREVLTRIFSPLNDGGVLRITDTGYDRAIQCMTLGGLEFNADPAVGWHVRTVVQLRASDPTWYDPTPVSGGATPTPDGTPTPVPLTIPWVAGASNIDSIITTTNAGTWLSYPLITVVGPVTNLVITNLTTSDTIKLSNVPAGDIFLINLLYGQKTVTDQDGGNQASKVSADSNLATFAIDPGTHSISVFGESTDIMTTVSFVYYTRYIGV